jgi:succinate dehydrogenase/fumarate reductase flavoprotein subunit
VIQAETLEGLAEVVAQRLAKYSSDTGGLTLAKEFLPNLKVSIQRFNQTARQGRDEDFHRGESAIQKLFNGPVKAGSEYANPTLYPLAETGPYYAALITGGNLDTKGGPKTNSHGQVLNTANEPIPGLFGVGNCVASASGRAYWSGGATLGPIMAFAYRVANQAHLEPVKA